MMGLGVFGVRLNRLGWLVMGGFFCWVVCCLIGCGGFSGFLVFCFFFGVCCVVKVNVK